jgi:hypothetical protein
MTPDADPSGGGPPALRASDAEREATATRHARGLEPLTRDLPSAPAAEGRRWMIGFMGGGTERGRWRIAKRSNVINVIDGADLDLTDAVVDGAEIEITR